MEEATAQAERHEARCEVLAALMVKARSVLEQAREAE
jgi:hypothetical protein